MLCMLAALEAPRCGGGVKVAGTVDRCGGIDGLVKMIFQGSSGGGGIITLSPPRVASVLVISALLSTLLALGAALVAPTSSTSMAACTDAERPVLAVQ
jgi:hypothetical protein